MVELMPGKENFIAQIPGSVRRMLALSTLNELVRPDAGINK